MRMLMETELEGRLKPLREMHVRPSEKNVDSYLNNYRIERPHKSFSFQVT